MSENDLTLNSELDALFADADTPRGAEAFTARVMADTAHVSRLKYARRLAVALALAVVAIPMHEVGEQAAFLLATDLIALPPSLVADILAPLNSVGGLLTGVLLGLRSLYFRMIG